MAGTALVVGASGIVGSATATLLTREGWTVHGLARSPGDRADIRPVAADLRDAGGTAAALAGLRPDAVFITTWLRQPTEAENIRVNAAMVRNLLDALRPAGSVRHVALVTGLKHYLGPFEAYGQGVLPQTPFREEQGRLDVENFYYAQEDELFAAATRDGFGWSVHRPHTVIGQAVGNAMNMGSTLAAYALPHGARTLIDRDPDPVPNRAETGHRLHLHLHGSGAGFEAALTDFAATTASADGIVKVRLHLPEPYRNEEPEPAAPDVGHRLPKVRRRVGILELGWSSRLDAERFVRGDAYAACAERLRAEASALGVWQVKGVYTFIRDGALTIAGLRGSRAAELIEQLGALNQTEEAVTRLFHRD